MAALQLSPVLLFLAAAHWICCTGALPTANVSFAAFCVPGSESTRVCGSIDVQAVMDRHGLVLCKFEFLPLLTSSAGDEHVSTELCVTLSYSPTLHQSDLEFVANTTRIATIASSSNLTNASEPNTVALWINVTLPTAGLWRVVPTTTLLKNDNGTASTSSITTVAAEALVIVRPPDVAVEVELLPKNQSIIARGSTVYIRATTPSVALALDTCTNAVQQRIVADSTTTPAASGSSVVSTTTVTSIGLNGSWTTLPLSTRNPLADTVIAVFASSVISCRTPDATLSAIQRSLAHLISAVASIPLTRMSNNQSVAETILNFSSVDDPVAVSSQFLGSDRVTLVASYTVLPSLPLVTLPTSLPRDLENPHSTADPPVNITIVAPTLRSYDPAVNISAFFLSNALQIALMTLVLPGVESERSALQISAQSTASFTPHRGANEYRLMLVHDSAVCAFFQVFVDGSVATSFPSSPITCRLYEFDKGVGDWVYVVCGSVLGTFLALTVADDVRMALRKALSNPTHLGSGGISAAGGAPSSWHALTTTVGASASGTQSSSGDVRATYMRLCATAAGLHDIGSFISNVCFIVFCLSSTQRHWTMLIAMMVIVLVALVTLAVRVHVTMMVMPSRVDIRSGYHVIEVLSGLDDRRPTSSDIAAVGNSPRPRDPHRNGGLPSQELDVALVAPRKRPVPTRRRARNGPGAPTGEGGGSNGGGIARLPGTNTIARYPLETHFWPVANIVVFLLDSAAEGVEFTAVPRSFWFGVQRWVQDVPALVVVCFFTAWFPKETNSASVAQLFVAAIGIAFGYKGVFTVCAVLVVTLFSRCLCRGQASNLEIWLRDRTGLHIVSAESRCAGPPLRGGGGVVTTPLTPLSSSGVQQRAALFGNSGGSSQFPASLSASTTVPPPHLPPLALRAITQQAAVGADAVSGCGGDDGAASLCVGVFTPPRVDKGLSDPFGHHGGDNDEDRHDDAHVVTMEHRHLDSVEGDNRVGLMRTGGSSHGSHLLAIGSAKLHPAVAPFPTASSSSLGCGSHYLLPTFRDPYFSDRDEEVPADNRSGAAVDDEDATMIVHESVVFSETGGAAASRNPR